MRSYVREHRLSYRLFWYILGMLLLAFGLILNAETLLGTSPLLSAPYALAAFTGASFANMTLVWYLVLSSL